MEFYMGQALGQPELPAGSPRPAETPEEGIIVVDNDPDGMTRRYLYKSMNGEKSEVMISEAPTEAFTPAAPVARAKVSRRNALKAHTATVMSGVPLGETKPVKIPGLGNAQPEEVLPENRPLKVAGGELGAIQKLNAAPVGTDGGTNMLQMQVPASPKMGEAVLKGSPSLGVPVVSKAPVPVDDSVVRDNRALPAMQGQLGGPTTFLDTSVRVMVPSEPVLGTVPQKQAAMGTGLPLVSGPSVSLGQTTPQTPTPAPQEAPPVEPGTCPGAVEMPDGRVIEPDDGIRLQDLCELMPFLLESYGALQQAKQGNGKVAPGQSVPVRGQAPGGPGAVPTSASQFGPAGGAGGGGFVGSGGGGGPGPVGPKGNQGPVGPLGFGGIVDSIQKTDGDFSAGPGAFIAVPGTSLMFVQSQAGPATFLLNASLGSTSGASGLCQSGQIGLKVDGTDYPLASRLIHTFAGGVAEFIVAQPCILTLQLSPGPHTVEVILRGLAPGEFGGTGLGIPCGVSAVPAQPLDLAVVHN